MNNWDVEVHYDVALNKHLSNFILDSYKKWITYIHLVMNTGEYKDDAVRYMLLSNGINVLLFKFHDKYKNSYKIECMNVYNELIETGYRWVVMPGVIPLYNIREYYMDAVEIIGEDRLLNSLKNDYSVKELFELRVRHNKEELIDYYKLDSLSRVDKLGDNMFLLKDSVVPLCENYCLDSENIYSLNLSYYSKTDYYIQCNIGMLNGQLCLFNTIYVY